MGKILVSRSAKRRMSFLAALALAACDSGAPSPTALPPSVANLGVQANPTNALSTLVTFAATGADSARVFYWAASGAAAGALDSTPFMPLPPGTAAIATLGLRPASGYRHQVELVGRGGRARSDSVEFTTGALPADLQTVALAASQPWQGGGYLLTSVFLNGATSYAVAFDSTGAIRWYRGFGGGLGIGELKQQPNGRFTAYLGQSFGWQPTYGRYLEFGGDGSVVAEYSAATPFYTDNHELLITTGADGADRLHLFGYDLRVTDLSAYGGSATALLAGHQLLRQTAAGTPEFMWNAWDHLTLADWIEEPASLKQLPNIDFDHPNSLDFDLDSNYIVSFRSLAEITKIDAVTGATLWRLGGVNNQFTFVNDPLGGFNGQHSVRVLPDGHLLVFDNGWRHSPPESRAVEYAVDPVAMTATLVWEYRHAPTIFTGFTGSVQRLAGGHTLVGFAGAGHATEVRPDGSVAWEGDLTVAGQPYAGYRLIRIASLYGYRRP